MNEAERLRLQVAAAVKTGIPLALAERLRGDSAEAIEADAVGFAKALGIRPDAATVRGRQRELR